MAVMESLEQRATREILQLLPPGRHTLYVHEVADLLSCTSHHIHDLIIEGRISALRVGMGRRKHYRILISSLREFLHSIHTGINPD